MGHLFQARAEMELTELTKRMTGWVLSVLSVRALGIAERLQADSSLSIVYLPAWTPPILGLMR
jgi:hypothetical protein